jgi:hypothetical protein
MKKEESWKKEGENYNDRDSWNAKKRDEELTGGRLSDSDGTAEVKRDEEKTITGGKKWGEDKGTGE